MDNCGISFGNGVKIVAKGDTFIVHCQFSIIHCRRSLPEKWQFVGQNFQGVSQKRHALLYWDQFISLLKVSSGSRVSGVLPGA